MAPIQAPKGVEDILPDEIWKWRAVETIARTVANLYHFHEIRTPVFEHTELFHRGVGETTDVVSKETYTFQDRGGRSITLRPEGTAGVVRAMIEHNLIAHEGSRQKVYYIGPNFRYEKPQSGRLRQHHQFGVEAFGIAQPEQDVECIRLQMDFYRQCGLKGLSLRVNSLGDGESKAKYRAVLANFLKPKAPGLSEDSIRRLETNPLRILDSKDPRDVQVCQDAPPAFESLSQKSQDHLKRVEELLTQAGVPFFVDGKLVRGFDYYTDTIWEFVAEGIGAQNAVGGGGRYDNLVENLGGKPTPGVGFGSGIERLLMALAAQNAQLPPQDANLVWLAYHGDPARHAQWNLLYELRAAGVSADMDCSGRSIKAQFKLANRENAKYCVVVGDTELANGTVVLKDLASGHQTTLARGHLLAALKEKTPSH